MGQIRGKYPREMKLEVCKFGSQFYHNDNYVNKRSINKELVALQLKTLVGLMNNLTAAFN